METALLHAVMLAVLFVNGWTDAPNAIATAVSTGVLPFRRAALLAAVCELAGVLIMSLLCPTVAATIFNMADLGTDPAAALAALQGALLTIVLWAVLAWRFGIPTSESHALIAALTGAAAALHGDLSGVSAEAWGKVLAGLVLSTLLGWLAGHWAASRVKRITLSENTVHFGQKLSAGAMAFLHGAQDGQKLLAVFLLLRALAEGRTASVFAVFPGSAVLCAAVMALGVFCGGRRIIEGVARGTGALTPPQGLAADCAGAVCLLAASLLGLPVSTTHTKVSAMLGAGAAGGGGGRPSAVLGMALTWLLTFPCCFLLSWFLTGLMV